MSDKHAKKDLPMMLIGITRGSREICNCLEFLTGGADSLRTTLTILLNRLERDGTDTQIIDLLKEVAQLFDELFEILQRMRAPARLIHSASLNARSIVLEHEMLHCLEMACAKKEEAGDEHVL